MIARLFCRLALAVGVVLAVAVPAFADVPASRDLSFKAPSFDELPRLDPKATLGLNSADRAKPECVALCEFAAAVEVDPLGYGSTPRPFEGKATPFGRQYLYAHANPTMFVDPTGHAADEPGYWATFGYHFSKDLGKVLDGAYDRFVGMLTPGDEGNEGAAASQQRNLLELARNEKKDPVSRAFAVVEATKLQVAVVVEENVILPMGRVPENSQKVLTELHNVGVATDRTGQVVGVLGAVVATTEIISALTPLVQKAPGLPRVRLNKLQGTLGEDVVRARLVESKTLDLVEEQVRIRTDNQGGYRVTDFLVRSKQTGKLSIIEVKTGAATRDAAQHAKDQRIADPNLETKFFGRRARAANLPNETPTGSIRTFEVNADNVRPKE